MDLFSVQDVAYKSFFSAAGGVVLDRGEHTDDSSRTRTIASPKCVDWWCGVEQMQRDGKSSRMRAMLSPICTDDK